jgi:hypothetical protein
MTISRMQQPRQMYGLGSLVKSIGKSVKSFVKSDLGKAALLGAGIYGLGGGTFFGKSLPGLAAKGGFGLGNIAPNVMNYLVGTGGGSAGFSTKGILGSAGKFSPMGITAGITAASALAAIGLDPENPNDMPRNTEALKSYLRQGYLTLNPQAQPDEVEEFVEANTVEYRANGGRIGFADGMLSFEEAKAMNPGMFSAEVETDVVRPNTELLNYIKRIRDAVEKGIIPMDFAMDLVKQKTMEQGVDLQDLRDDIMETQRIEQAYGGRMGYADGTSFQRKALEKKGYSDMMQNMTPKEISQLYDSVMGTFSRRFQAYGGRMGYAFGNPEDNAMRASGIMNLPLNQNPAGVTELDLRETGGFIPPVGVKEKADDIPAMLSNNEFVFTADAVRNMGNGDVNKGAQRMYDMMKKLENGGRV